MSELISIIIPTFNRAHLIEETLDSVLQQTYEHWECIVVDDGSTDHTIEVLKDYGQKDARFRYFKRPDNLKKGANSCRNYGFEKSEGEFVQWFDSDDIMLPSFLAEKISAFTQSHSMVICAGYEANETLQNRQKIDLNYTSESSLFKQYVMWTAKVFTPSVLIRKSFLKGKQLFSNQITRGQETELFSRLFYNLKEDQFHILNKGLFVYRQHAQNKTQQNKEYTKHFKESQRMITLENFRKSITLKDQELIDLLYSRLIRLFFSGLRNDHKDHSKIVLDGLVKELKTLNPSKSRKVYILGSSCLLLRPTFKAEQTLKNMKLQ